MALRIRDSKNSGKAAVKSLLNQLDLAVQLLQNANASREAIQREDEVIEAAREAVRYSMSALERLPQLPPGDLIRVETSMKEFRSALKKLREPGPVR